MSVPPHPGNGCGTASRVKLIFARHRQRRGNNFHIIADVEILLRERDGVRLRHFRAERFCHADFDRHKVDRHDPTDLIIRLHYSRFSRRRRDRFRRDYDHRRVGLCMLLWQRR